MLCQQKVMLAILKLTELLCLYFILKEKYLICNRALMHFVLVYNRWKAKMACNKVNLQLKQQCNEDLKVYLFSFRCTSHFVTGKLEFWMWNIHRCCCIRGLLSSSYSGILFERLVFGIDFLLICCIAQALQSKSALSFLI